MAELAANGIKAKFASYGDDLGAMLASTAENKVFTFDGAAGTGIFAQGEPYFWGTRAIPLIDSMPGLLKWMKDAHPNAQTVGVVRWDLGVTNNDATKDAVVARIEASGYELNKLYELVPIGNQDFSQVIQKVRANEPDILLLSIGDPDLGSFNNQATTAGLKAVRIGFDFTPEGVKASKGTYDSDGFTFAYDYFDPRSPKSPLARKFVDEFNKTYGLDPDLYAAHFYEEPSTCGSS